MPKRKKLIIKCSGGCGRRSPDMAVMAGAGAKLGFKKTPTWTCAECYRKGSGTATLPKERSER